MHKLSGPAGKKSRKAILFRLLKYFFRYKFSVAAAIVLLVASNLFALLGPMLSGSAINAIDLESGVDFETVIVCCVLMAVFYAVSSLFTYILSVLMIRLSQKIVKRMRQDVFEKLLTLPVGYFDRLQAGDIINRISYDIDTVNASLSNDILQISTGVITVAGAFIGMAFISPVLLAVFLFTIPVSIWITVTRSKSVRPLFRKRSAKLAELNGLSEEMLSGLKTIKAYGREKQIAAKFADKNTEAVNAYYRADYYGSLIGPSVNFVNNLGTALISTVGSILYLLGGLYIGDVSAFLLYARRFSGPVNEFANIISEIQSALAAAERVFGVLDAQPEKEDAEDAKILKNTAGNVAFKEVCFGYSEDIKVIKNLSFFARGGEVVAIVGPTGVGKTTIVNLLMRFYDPQSGAIEIDGENIASYTRKSLRAAFTMVLQDTWLFEGTIRENIAYGKEGAAESEIRAVAKAAHIDGFIEALPQGYDTRVTDGGVNLSKGQKQLLTIARSMLSSAKMLILDEATSNVDTRTEILIRDAMLQLMRGRTCFVIAHRLSTVKNADLILVVKDGGIVEKGKHDELLRKNGFYAEIYRAQFE